MGRYRAKDLLLLPGLVSLTRIPLAICFPFFVDHAPMASVILALAAVSDVLDGYFARRLSQATPTGAVLDGVTDKLFVASVVASLLVLRKLSWSGALLLGARDLGEAPLVLWWLVSHQKRSTRAEDPKANLPGKAATVLQFAAVVSAIHDSAVTTELLWVAGSAGALAAASYWVRELRA